MAYFKTENLSVKLFHFCIPYKPCSCIFYITSPAGGQCLFIVVRQNKADAIVNTIR